MDNKNETLIKESDTTSQKEKESPAQFIDIGKQVQQQSMNELTARLLNLKTMNASREDINRAFGNLVSSNPDLRNRVLKNLKTLPYLPDKSDLESALENPKDNEELLRAVGANLSNNSYPFYKMVRLYDGILTYKYYAIPENVNPDFMSKPRFKNESRFVNEWLEKLNPQYQLRRVVQETLQSGKRAYFLRETFAKGSKKSDNLAEDIIPSTDISDRRVRSVTLQDLPDKYVKIVGRSAESYYTIAFNFAYFFSESGVNINEYPSVFKKYYEDLKSFIKKDTKTGRFKFDEKKASAFAKQHVGSKYGYTTGRVGSSFVPTNFYYWVNIPSDVCQVFSADESNALQAPNFMGLYLMGINLQAYNIVQQQLTSIPLYSMVVGQIPTVEDDKKNPLMLDSNQVDYFTSMINSLMPDGTVFVMTPTKDNKVITFDEQPNATKVYASALQDIIGTAGLSGLTSTTDKPNLSQIKTSQLTEKRFVDVFYDQFMDFINRRLDRMTEEGYLRYDWKVKMYGNIFTDRDDLESLMKMLTTGQTHVLPKMLGYLDITLDDAVSLANQVKGSGLYDLFEPLMSAYQQGGGAGEGTKREIPDSQVDNDNTAKSKEAGTNKNQDRISFIYSKISELDEGELGQLREILEGEGGE